MRRLRCAYWFVCSIPAACSSADGGGTIERARTTTSSSTVAAVGGNGAHAGAAIGGSAARVSGTPSSPDMVGRGAAGSGGPPMRGLPGLAGTSGAAINPAAMSGDTTMSVAPGSWAAADPGKTGPFPTVTENNVGHDMAFTMFRPKELTQRHPVITWGNGTGASPSAYRSLLNLYASHGFIVIASNSPNVAQGTPPPMLDGVTWVLEQDMMDGSVLYQRVDRDHIGATGHSQGAFAASSAGTDTRIKTIAPIETLGTSRGLHGPVLGLCGGMDTTVPCSGNMRNFNGIMDQPAMYAELKAADHGSWLGRGAGGVNPMFMITNAWFRVHLMNDMALRPMFYGACSLCQDAETWVTMRKMMDQ